jgi:vacuolar-type H+-ATPase subunit H
VSEEPVRASPLLEASRRVAKIMRAAEDAAQEVTNDAERRADARIAEAARAAQNRVNAAEEEAEEILAEAKAEAARLRESAAAESETLLDGARAETSQLLEDARREANDVQRIAEVFANSTREGAEEAKRKQMADARGVASAVLSDGQEMHDNLRQLADSLVRNAELLLRDVTIAHRAMMNTLAEAGVDVDPDPRGGYRDEDFGDVPEFIPRR